MLHGEEICSLRIGEVELGGIGFQRSRPYGFAIGVIFKGLALDSVVAQEDTVLAEQVIRGSKYYARKCVVMTDPSLDAGVSADKGVLFLTETAIVAESLLL